MELALHDLIGEFAPLTASQQSIDYESGKSGKHNHQYGVDLVETCANE